MWDLRPREVEWFAQSHTASDAGYMFPNYAWISNAKWVTRVITPVTEQVLSCTGRLNS